MKLNTAETQLKDCIHIERQIIPAAVCDQIVASIQDQEWKKHQWHKLNEDSFSEQQQELSILFSSADMQQSLEPYIIDCAKKYNEKYYFSSEDRLRVFLHSFSRLRFNRYVEGEIMRQHYDHIYSLFDGGIPVLSFVLNLNDDYEGGKLYFWEDYEVDLCKGDVIMFPSLFLFPHGVKAVTKGVRYSAVAWAW
jgi:predicted 2-oxoglutarate/Fe(II)-dependent dioxygenase YbiX